MCEAEDPTRKIVTFKALVRTSEFVAENVYFSVLLCTFLQVPNSTNFTTYQLDSVSTITNRTFEQLSDNTVFITFLLQTDQIINVTVTLVNGFGVKLAFEYSISKT